MREWLLLPPYVHILKKVGTILDMVYFSHEPWTEVVVRGLKESVIRMVRPPVGHSLKVPLNTLHIPFRSHLTLVLSSHHP